MGTQAEIQDGVPRIADPDKSMPKIDKNEAREERIRNRVIVDAYTPEEQVIGWHTYLGDKIRFPLQATCIGEMTTSPLLKGEEVRVSGMVPEHEVSRGMFVTVEWQGREMGVPLEQLEPIDADNASEEAIRDWHYLKDRGHQLP
jgi:hypothetical protein